MKINIFKILLFFVTVINLQCLRTPHTEEDLVIKFSNIPEWLSLDKMENARGKIRSRMNGLKKKFNSTSIRLDNGTIENPTNSKIIAESELVSEKRRLVKFYVSLKTGCHVEVNDTIIYDKNNMNNPIEHIVRSDTIDNYKINPKGVYSSDVDIEYFGFSRGIKTFSTYYKSKPNVNNKETVLEYLYEASNLIKTHSDFRDEASYENISYNYNIMTWNFLNKNFNKKPQNVKIEYYFDLGEQFANEDTRFTFPMNKTTYQVNSDDSNEKKKTIVKFDTELNLKFNETHVVQARIPLYFEDCKNYKLNTLVFVTGFLLIAFLLFVIYRTIHVIFDEEKD